MKRFVVGIIIGIGLSLAISVNAEQIESVVGKLIQGEFPVKVGDKQLANKAIVVDGTSYLPVREFGESIGYDVLFNPEGEIVLNRKVTGTPEYVKKLSELNAASETLYKKNNELSEEISNIFPLIDQYENIHRLPDGSFGVKEPDDFYSETKAMRDALITERAKIDKEIQEISVQMNELVKNNTQSQQ